MKKYHYLAYLFIFLFILPKAVYSFTNNEIPKIYFKPLPNLSLTFDPALMEDMYSFHIASQIYDTLFQYDEFLTIKPHLVSSYKTSDDGKIIVFTLRPNIKFHNSKSLAADDVIYTLQRFLKKTPHKYPELFLIEGSQDFVSGRSASVKGLKKISELSFEITLSLPSPTIFMVLSTQNLAILPKDFDSSPNRFIGTGPFKVKDYKKNKSLELEANKEYFRGIPKLEKIIYTYADRKEAIDKFNRGLFHDLQWYNPKPEEINISYNVAKFAVPRVAVLLFNTKKSPFNNRSAREAFSVAINKDKLMSACFSDKFNAQGFIPYGIGGYDKGLKASEYNITKAKKLYSTQFNKTTPINIIWKEYHPCGDKFGELVKKDLESVGFSPNFRAVTYDRFWEIVNTTNSFDVVEVMLSIDYPEALPLLNYFKSNYKYNLSGFSSKEYDNLLKLAIVENDKYRRYNLYDQAQKILQRENVEFSLFYDVESIIYQKNISSFITPSVPVSSLPLSLFDLDNK